MKLTYSLSVIDDEQTIRESIALSLGKDYRIKTYATAEAALKKLKRNPPDLILLDIGLPGMDGIDALREFKAYDPLIPVIMITAYEDIQTVISAMKSGAYDYVVKPLHMDALRVTIRNALETVRLRKEVELLQERYLKENIPFFIGESDAIQDVMAFIGMIAKSPDTPVLIVGETGTGKELIASAIHYRSPNFKGPLVTVNCAAIPKELIESELFGYEKGAFSGAKASGKTGLIEEASAGTLFLDEVGDLSLEAQAKLLRFLEEGEFYRVGGLKKLHVQTRVVSATNKDLNAMVTQDLFRKDLYYRLGVVRVEVPSLNKRRADILPLAKHFLLEFSRKFEKQVFGFSSEAEEALMKHSWVGNVRELKNYIERAVLTTKESELSPRDLGIEESMQNAKATREGAAVDLPALLPAGVDFEDIETKVKRYYIEQALKMADGNVNRAARLLGLNHHTFRYQRKKLTKE